MSRHNPPVYPAPTDLAHRIGLEAIARLPKDADVSQKDAVYMEAKDASMYGLTLLDYFAARAPHEIPSWFVPEMNRPCPPHKWISESGFEYKSAYLAEQAVGEDGFHDANTDARDDWEREYLIQKFAQWPWFWAFMVMEARK